MPFFIVENDITKMDTEAVVVSADVSLKATGGMIDDVYNAVSDPESLARVCERIGFCGGCESVVTQSFGLPSKYIIHTVAPIYDDSKEMAEQYIKTCYKNAIYMARMKMFESIAVPLIGTGKKGFPKKMVSEIGTKVIKNFLEKYDMNIWFVVHNKKSFIVNEYEINAVEKYLTEKFINNTVNIFESTSDFAKNFSFDSYNFFQPSVTITSEVNSHKFENYKKDNFSEQIKENNDFSGLLKQKMKQHKIRDNMAYKKSNIEKNAFLRLKNGTNTSPGKNVVLAIAIGFEMDLNEADQFFRKSGYKLSCNDKRDVIVQYFIENKIYDIFELNKVLFYFDEEQLGALV